MLPDEIELLMVDRCNRAFLILHIKADVAWMSRRMTFSLFRARGSATGRCPHTNLVLVCGMSWTHTNMNFLPFDDVMMRISSVCQTSVVLGHLFQGKEYSRYI